MLKISSPKNHNELAKPADMPEIQPPHAKHLIQARKETKEALENKEFDGVGTA